MNKSTKPDDKRKGIKPETIEKVRQWLEDYLTEHSMNSALNPYSYKDTNGYTIMNSYVAAMKKLSYYSKSNSGVYVWRFDQNDDDLAVKAKNAIIKCNEHVEELRLARRAKKKTLKIAKAKAEAEKKKPETVVNTENGDLTEQATKLKDHITRKEALEETYISKEEMPVETTQKPVDELKVETDTQVSDEPKTSPTEAEVLKTLAKSTFDSLNRHLTIMETMNSHLHSLGKENNETNRKWESVNEGQANMLKSIDQLTNHLSAYASDSSTQDDDRSTRTYYLFGFIPIWKVKVNDIRKYTRGGNNG